MLTGAGVGVAACLLTMMGGRAAAWISLAFTVLTAALVIWVLGRSVVSAARAVGWEVSDPRHLLAGVLLMAGATLTCILLARAAWRRDVTPMVSVMGAAFGLLIAVIGAALWIYGLAIYHGFPGVGALVEWNAAAWIQCSVC